MTTRIVVRPRADRDIELQAEYIASRSGAEAGLRFLKSTEATFQLLARQPEMGSKRWFDNPALTGVRAFPAKGFEKCIVFYRHMRKGIEIIRVLHGARDIARIMESE